VNARKRAAAVALLTAGLVGVVSADDLHAWVVGWLPVVDTVIRQRPVLGVAVFVVLSALSAMLFFVSSAVFVPVAVFVWGTGVSTVLLLAGWILGGVFAYTVSRHLGRAVVNALVSTSWLDWAEARFTRSAPFGLVLLFQLAVPSEVPGYVLGLLRYPFWKYLAVVGIGELPFAAATIYLGTGFIERRIVLLVGVGAALAAFSGTMLWMLQRRVREPAGNTTQPDDEPT